MRGLRRRCRSPGRGAPARLDKELLWKLEWRRGGRRSVWEGGKAVGREDPLLTSNHHPVLCFARTPTVLRLYSGATSRISEGVRARQLEVRPSSSSRAPALRYALPGALLATSGILSARRFTAEAKLQRSATRGDIAPAVSRGTRRLSHTAVLPEEATSAVRTAHVSTTTRC